MRSSAKGLGLLALFAVLTVWHAWPLAPQATTHMQSGADPKTMMASLLDLSGNLVSDPLRLLDGSTFYPHDRTLAAVDHQISNALLSVPFRAAGLEGVTIFNLVVLASFVLSGVFTALLVHRLSGSWHGGVVAGIAFAFATTRATALPHSHVLSTQWLPLALWCLHRFLDRPTLRRGAGLLAASLLVSFASWQGFVIGGVGLAVVTLWELAWRSDRRRVLGVAVVGLACVLALLPLASVYVEVAERWPATRSGELPLRNLVRSSAQLGSPLLAMPAAAASPVAGFLPEARGVIFPGLVVLLLAIPEWLRTVRGGRWNAVGRALAGMAAGLCALTVILAITGWLPGLRAAVASVAPWALLAVLGGVTSLWSVRREPSGERRVARPYVALACAGAVLALGPRITLGGEDLGSGLWRLDLLPVPLLLRDPSRFGLLLGLACAVLAGLTVARWQHRFDGRRALLVTVAIAAALNVDLAFSMPELAPVPARTAVDHWLSEDGGPGAVVEFPVHGNYWAIYASQQFYERPNVDGRGFLRPPGVRALRATDDFEEQIRLLWEYASPRYVVIRGGLYGPAERRDLEAAVTRLGAALELRAQDGLDAVYELFDRESSDHIVRRWPQRDAAERDRSLVLAGSLDAGFEGTRTILAATLNGVPVGDWTETEFQQRSEIRAALPADVLVAGENVLELRTRYEWLPERVAHPIGGTGLVARTDVRLMASDRGGLAIINGTLTRIAERCWVGILDPPSGVLTGDAVSTCADSDRAVEAQLDLLAAASAHQVVLVVVKGGVEAVSSRLSLALADFGVSVATARLHMAAIGVAGSEAEATLSASAAGAAEAEVRLGDPVRRNFDVRRLDVR